MVVIAITVYESNAPAGSPEQLHPLNNQLIEFGCFILRSILQGRSFSKFAIYLEAWICAREALNLGKGVSGEFNLFEVAVSFINLSMSIVHP